MAYYSPPQRRQHQGNIISMASITFIVSFCCLLYVTWDIGTSWPSLDQQLSLWGNTLVYLLLDRDLMAWQQYWYQLTSKKNCGNTHHNFTVIHHGCLCKQFKQLSVQTVCLTVVQFYRVDLKVLCQSSRGSQCENEPRKVAMYNWGDFAGSRGMF